MSIEDFVQNFSGVEKSLSLTNFDFAKFLVKDDVKVMDGRTKVCGKSCSRHDLKLTSLKDADEVYVTANVWP